MISLPFRGIRCRELRRSVLRIFPLLALLLPQAVPAQGAGDLFRGTWQAETPEQGTLVLILKRNQLASYFWADNPDTTVYQGRWTSEGDAATLDWADGSSHRLVRDSLGFGITYFDADGTEGYTTPTQQLPQDVLGQWAKPPSAAEEPASDRDRAKGFFGTWKVGEEDEVHFVVIEADRSAASTWSSREGEARGLRGAWAKQGSELHVAWDSGHYSIFEENPRGFTYRRIAPGVAIEADDSEARPATRVADANLPPAWLQSYRGEKDLNSGGVAFASRKEARNFYRGDWIIPRRDDRFERVSIGRFGGLATSADRDLQGSWLMSGQDVYFRWDDGQRGILSPVGWGFVLYEYQPGRPLDGVPSRIFPAAPANAEKLSAHLQDRAEVAERMLEMAEAAGIAPDTTQAGWGRTFMRWAWPFGEDDEASAEALLEAEFAESKDPWWWPVWSERPVEAEETAEEPAAEEGAEEPAEVSDAAPTRPEPPEMVETVDLPTETETVEVAEKATEDDIDPAEEPERPSRVKAPGSDRKADWIWPF